MDCSVNQGLSKVMLKEWLAEQFCFGELSLSLFSPSYSQPIGELCSDPAPFPHPAFTYTVQFLQNPPPINKSGPFSASLLEHAFHPQLQTTNPLLKH